MRRSERGFTLLEVIIAFALFAAIVVFAGWRVLDASDQSLSAERARQLRMLAEIRAGEIEIFEKYYDQPLSGDFDDLPEEIRDAYEGWEWETEIRDVTVFGLQKDEAAPYLFTENDPGTDPDAASSGGSSGGSGGTSKSKGETQILRELVLKVRSPSLDGASDEIEIVTYLPTVVAAAAAAGGTPK